MPNEKTRADSLREYLTGASSDGGAQTDPDASLGNFRSSTGVVSMTAVVTDPIWGITIDYISGGNAIGEGTLNAVDANTLQWKDAGGSYGAGVAIANGETKIVEASGDPGAYLRVSRISPTAMEGTSTLVLSRAINNVFGLDDVTSAEALAGDNEYRGTIVVNESATDVLRFRRWIGTIGTALVSGTAQLGGAGAGTIEIAAGSFADWPDSGFCHIKTSGGVTRELVYYSERTDTVLTVPADGREMLGTTAAAGAADDDIHCVPPIAIAEDTAGVTAGGAAIQTIAGEGTPPVAVVWQTGITEATGVDVGAVGAAQQVGMWAWRETPPGAVATPDVHVIIEESFGAA